MEQKLILQKEKWFNYSVDLSFCLEKYMPEKISTTARLIHYFDIPC
jgi:hypothetical protein